MGFAYAGPTKRPNHHQGAHASTSIATDSRIKRSTSNFLQGAWATSSMGLHLSPATAAELHVRRRAGMKIIEVGTAIWPHLSRLFRSLVETSEPRRIQP